MLSIAGAHTRAGLDDQRLRDAATQVQPRPQAACEGTGRLS
jgi:hypothetical protein